MIFNWFKKCCGYENGCDCKNCNKQFSDKLKNLEKL